MRPVEKYDIRDTVRFDDGQESNIIIKKHRDASPFLLQNLGNYCSYCECCCTNGFVFHVEHIRPQNSHADLIREWDNFLVGCGACNGPGGKWTADMPRPNTHLPHKNNTIYSLIYDESGGVRVNPEMSEESKLNAQALIDWLKLNKSPKSAIEDRDGRCEMRRKTWEKAVDLRNDYEHDPSILNHLMDIIKPTGCWSIWFTVFKDHEDVRRALVEQFPGTARNCFDEHFNPVPRHPENTDDPI